MGPNREEVRAPAGASGFLLPTRCYLCDGQEMWREVLTVFGGET